VKKIGAVIKKTFKKTPQSVKSDGKFYVNEKVGITSPMEAYSYYGINVIKGKIEKIVKYWYNRYTYLVSYNDTFGVINKFWTESTYIKKLQDCEFVEFDYLKKFKVGQKVFLLTNSNEYYENVEIMEINPVLNKKVFLYTVKLGYRIKKVCSHNLFLNKTILNNHQFKTGDKVFYAPSYIFMKNQLMVEEVFLLKPSNKVYLKIKKHDTALDCTLVEKYKEPLRIFSEIDPYGEEDWSN